MVRFTIWSSHSPQTLLMLYRRTDGMISTAGFVIGKVKSFAVSSVPGFITLSVWDWHRNQRGTGFVLNVRLVPDEWIRYLPRFLSFLFLPFSFTFSNNPNRGKRNFLPSHLLSPGRPLFGAASALAAAQPLLERLCTALHIVSASSWVFGLLWNLQLPPLLLQWTSWKWT